MTDPTKSLREIAEEMTRKLWRSPILQREIAKALQTERDKVKELDQMFYISQQGLNEWKRKADELRVVLDRAHKVFGAESDSLGETIKSLEAEIGTLRECPCFHTQAKRKNP